MFNWKFNRTLSNIFALIRILDYKSISLIITFVIANSVAIILEIGSLLIIGIYLSSSDTLLNNSNIFLSDITMTPNFIMSWIIASYLLRLLATYAMHTSCIHMARNLTFFLGYHISKSNYETANNHDTSKYSNASQFLITELMFSFVLSLAKTISAIFVLIVILNILFLLSPSKELGIAFLSLLVLMVAILVLLRPIYRKNGAIAAGESASLIGTVTYFLLSIRELNIIPLQEYFRNKMNQHQKLFRKASSKIGAMSDMQRPTVEFLIYASIIIATIQSSTDINGSALGLLLVSLRVLPFLHSIMNSVTQVLYATKYIDSFLDLRSIKRDEAKFTVQDQQLFEAQNVTKAFANAKPIFQKLSFKIEGGDKVALVAPSGTGKSVFIDIITGHATASSGTLSYAGREVTGKDLSKIFLYVPQRVTLLDETIVYNITLDHHIKDTEWNGFLNSYSYLGIQDILSHVSPNTSIGENGRLLSGGQRQRVALARALFHYNEGQILILDEVTSALNASAEEEIWQQLLLDSEKTIIAVTHNPTLQEKFGRKLKLLGA